MAQRQNRMVAPVNPDDSYEAYKSVQSGTVVKRPLTLHSLFNELNAGQRNNLISHYLGDLSKTITALRDANCLYADEARKFYFVLKNMHISNRRSFESMQFPQQDLIALIHATKALITTPLLIDGNANPQFAVRVNDFDRLIQKYKRERTTNLFDGFVRAGNALVASAFTALVALLSVIGTFGLLSIAALAVGGLITAKQGMLAAGHYGVAAKQKTMYEAMQPLVMAVQNQRVTVGK